MARIIDEFSVKPSGFLASWRYARVLIDDDGNLSVQGVPGKPFPNLPCISDYNKVDRRYSSSVPATPDNLKKGSLITEFCNLTTFTNYKVYAQNCTPYAYVQAQVNAPQCGYLAPLPEPSVPPNPFGNPVYGEYYYFDYCDVDGLPISVKIFKKSYAGVPIKVEEGGKSPIVLKRSSSDTDNKFAPIRSTECVITFNSMVDFEFQRFYTDDEREYRADVYKDGNLVFSGYVIPDSAMEAFVAPPYPVTLRAVDGLGSLKNISYPIPAGSSIDIRQSFLDILCFCLAMTNLPLNIRTVCNLYESKMFNGIDDDPLAQATVNPLRLSDGKGNIMTCYEVLTQVLKLFGAYLVQQDGEWNFVRINELSNSVIRARVYNSKGFFLHSEQLAPLRVAGKDQDVLLINHDHQLRIGNAYKRVSGVLKFGEVPALIFNGDFEHWDGHNFTYWTKYGNINITQVQRQIRGTGGQLINVEDFACQFNERANSSKWIQANPIAAAKGSKIGLSFETSNTAGYNTVKMRLNIGKWYLFNQPTTTEYQWVQQLATCTVNVADSTWFGFPTGLYQSYTLNVPELPETGLLNIQLFGFVFLSTQGELNQPYTPCQIDNIGISINKPDGNVKNEKDGELYLSEQLGYYTSRPDPLEFLFGDFVPDYSITDLPFDVQVFGGINPFGDQTNLAWNNLVANGTIQDSLAKLYIIYTRDGSQSSAWYEYGQSSNQYPICMTTVKCILKSYQQPLRYMEGSFKGERMSYLDLLRFEVPNNSPFSNRVFAYLAGDFDLKYNEVTSGVLVELFSKNIFSNDVSVSHSNGDIEPPILQNPNNPSPATIGGIFTDEFSEQFL